MFGGSVGNVWKCSTSVSQSVYEDRNGGSSTVFFGIQLLAGIAAAQGCASVCLVVVVLVVVELSGG